MRRHPVVRDLLLAVVASCQASPVAAQCYDFGSTPVAGHWLDSPVPLGCAAVPDWPLWRLRIPWHREPGPHVGYNPGNAWPRPVFVFRYHCTGWLLLPVVVSSIRTNGYVVDQPEYACGSG